MSRLRPELGYSLAAAHLHHGLRGNEADRDLDFVRTLCDRLAIPLVASRWDTRARMRRRGLSGQAGLRRLRREFLRAAARRAGAVAIATGHQAEDQLETLLLRILRGTGLKGLGAMSPRRGFWIRPLLGVSRRDIEADLRNAGLSWREDRSNADLRYARSRVRHDAIPALLRSLGSGTDRDGRARAALAGRVGALLGEARQARRLVERRAARLLERARVKVLFSVAKRHGAALGVRPLLGAPRLVRATALRLAWRELKTGAGLMSRHLEPLLALLGREGGTGSVALPDGWLACRERERLSFQAPGADLRSKPPSPKVLRVPGVRLMGASLLRGSWLTGDQARRRMGWRAGQELFAADSLEGELQLRVGTLDEWFVPYGRRRPKRLGDFLRKERVSASVRKRPMVLADRRGILCILGVRRAARAPITSATRKALWIRLEPR